MSTKIQWTDETWNPVTGCTPVSRGCLNCHAAKMARRLHGMGLVEYRKGFDVTTHPHRLEQPLHWTRPRRVFVCSMGDLFHSAVPDDFIGCVWDIFAKAPQHTYQVSTKRPGRMARFMRLRVPLPNVWLGTSCEDQEAADKRVPKLLQCRAAVRFLGLEPLLGPIDLLKSERTPGACPHGSESCSGCRTRTIPGIDWVIVGPETGAGARPMQHYWARSIRDQSKKANVPFFFKGIKKALPRDLRIQEFPTASTNGQ